MAIDTNFNTNPYYDDFDEDKKFLRILFKPGFAVQARELTQIQTILQKQVERFGNHVFKNGSLVSGGEFFLQDATYLKLDTSYSGTDINFSEFEGQTIFSTDRTKRAQVLRAYDADAGTGDPVTLMVKQQYGEAFVAGETILTDAATASYANVSTSGVGTGQIFSVNEGIFYYEGFFVKNAAQTIAVSKYSNTNVNAKIGFEIDESVINYFSDTSLLDPAQDASNYQAPGADRFKIDLTLSTRSISSTDETQFIELMRVEDSKITRENKYPIYSVLTDTLARRTYDESGNYSVKQFNLSLENAANTAQTNVILSPGKAYVYGYEVATVSPTTITVDKPRQTSNVQNKLVSADYGAYVYTKNHYGVPPISGLGTVDVHCVAQSAINVTSTATISNTKIGTVRVKAVQFDSATDSSNSKTYVYATYLTDINISNTITGNVVSATSNTITIGNTVSGVVFSTVNDAYTGAKLRISTGPGTGEISKTIVSYNGATQVVTLDNPFISVPNTTSQFVLDFEFKNAESLVNFSGTTKTTSRDIDDKSKDFSTTYQDAYIAERSLEPVIFPLGQLYVTQNTISDMSFSYQRLYSSQLFSGNESPALSVGTSESISSATTTADKLQEYLVVVTGAGTSPYAVGSIVPADKISVDSGTRKLTIVNANNMTADIVATINVSLATKKSKVYVAANNTVQTASGVDVFSNSAITIWPTQGQMQIANTYVVKAPSTPQSLFVSDVLDLVSVLDFNGLNITSANVSAAVDVTTKYKLDNGQRESYYDHASISLLPGVTPPAGPLLVKVNRFTSSGAGFFTVDSYSGIAYERIPNYTSTASGEVFNLRDCLDFRAVRSDATAGGGSAVSFDVDSSTTGPKIPVNGSDITLDYSYYLPRIDKVIVNKDGTFEVTKGISSLTPKIPLDNSIGMTLYILENAPYVANTSQIQVTQIKNKRYRMTDIGSLEKRIDNLEYYTSLSLAELEALGRQDLSILDSQNLPRFKNGILVDTFNGSSVADVSNADYAASIDEVNKELRPSYEISSHNLKFDSSSSSNFVRKGPLITANGSTVTYIDQPKASKAINVNPFNVINYLGKIKLNPESDIWIDTERQSDVLVNLSGDLDAWQLVANNATQYVWNSWENNWQGIRTESYDVQNNRSLEKNSGRNWRQENAVGGENDIVRHTLIYRNGVEIKSGVRTTFTANRITESLGDRVVDVSVIPYMRSVNVLFTGTGFKPSTTLYPFFDNKSVENYVGNRVNKIYLTANNVNLLDSRTTAETVTIKDGASSNATGIVAHVSNNIVYITNVSPNTNFNFIANGTGTIVGQTTGSTYTISKYEHNGGNAAAAGASTITLRLDALGANNVSNYNSAPIFIVQGTGAGQQRTISSYNPSTRVATVDSAWTTTPDTTSFYSIGRLKSDESGSVAGIFTVPAGQFRVGEKVFRLVDNNTGDIPSSSTNGDASFFAQGLLQTKQETIVSTVGLSSQRVNYTEQRGVEEFLTKTQTVVWTDPLAQTFLISPTQYPEGVWLSSLRLCFKTKDEVIPVRVELRPSVNGYPSSSQVYPYSSVSLTPDKVNVTESPNVSSSAAYTEFPFESPVFLQPGEHSFVVLANSNKYEMYVAQMSQNDLVTGNQISEQPYGGSLFLSQNGSTWTADQNSDAMFRLMRYSFENTNASLFFNVDTPSEDVTYDLVNVINSDIILPNTSIAYEFQSEVEAGGYAGYKQITPQTNYEMLDGSGTRKLITASGNNTFILKATMATLSEAISPTIDVSRLGILAVHNKINNLGLANSDVTVVNVGSGYANTNDVTVTISGGGGSGAQAVANVVANTIDAVYITNAGSGYTGTPTITITPGSGGGSGANVIITGETSSAGGPALARYITRRVTLSEGFDSGDLRVYMTAYKPAGSDIHVYAKLLSASDPGLFEEKPWVLLTQIDNTNFVSTSVGDYREITYAPGIGGVANNSVSYTSGSSTFDTFKTFAIKIVFTGTNSYDVPKVRDFRVIALPAG